MARHRAAHRRHFERPALAGLRDRALFLVGFAGALRRSELIGLDVAQVTWTDTGMMLLIERSKTDAQGEGAQVAIPRGRLEETCPARQLGLQVGGERP